ncbi:hypothetical protein EV360DRAFT_86318 [Lentinula raphanica]|nr:hypothetical protein EV360DRAFT_86318 [Lentinula raphanica]
MSTLLPFHTSILNEIYDPDTSDLLVLARGLGLRRILCTLQNSTNHFVDSYLEIQRQEITEITDTPSLPPTPSTPSPPTLSTTSARTPPTITMVAPPGFLFLYRLAFPQIIVLSTTYEEETEIGEELGIMGCRKPGLRVVGYETGTSRDRQDLYKGGGLIAVTLQILVVDLLQNTIPVEKITGILVMHAERVSPLHLVSFITRLYREKNSKGFLKAFTDQPEHITSGLSPLKNIMKELQLRRVWIYPRFHQEVKDTLERKRADVVELAQNLTDNMNDIHGAIVQCMTITLAELRRSTVELDLENLNLPAAYFSSFDHIVRKQLDPIWLKVGPSTKALVRDLGVLRRLISYLLVYDPLQFHSFCQVLIEAAISNTAQSGSGSGKSQ